MLGMAATTPLAITTIIALERTTFKRQNIVTPPGIQLSQGQKVKDVATQSDTETASLVCKEEESSHELSGEALEEEESQARTPSRKLGISVRDLSVGSLVRPSELEQWLSPSVKSILKATCLDQFVPPVSQNVSWLQQAIESWDGVGGFTIKHRGSHIHITMNQDAIEEALKIPSGLVTLRGRQARREPLMVYMAPDTPRLRVKAVTNDGFLLTNIVDSSLQQAAKFVTNTLEVASVRKNRISAVFFKYLVRGYENLIGKANDYNWAALIYKEMCSAFNRGGRIMMGGLLTDLIKYQLRRLQGPAFQVEPKDLAQASDFQEKRRKIVEEAMLEHGSPSRSPSRSPTLSPPSTTEVAPHTSITLGCTVVDTCTTTITTSALPIQSDLFHAPFEATTVTHSTFPLSTSTNDTSDFCTPNLSHLDQLGVNLVRAVDEVHRQANVVLHARIRNLDTIAAHEKEREGLQRQIQHEQSLLAVQQKVNTLQANMAQLEADLRQAKVVEKCQKQFIQEQLQLKDNFENDIKRLKARIEDLTRQLEDRQVELIVERIATKNAENQRDRAMESAEDIKIKLDKFMEFKKTEDEVHTKVLEATEEKAKSFKEQLSLAEATFEAVLPSDARHQLKRAQFYKKGKEQMSGLIKKLEEVHQAELDYKEQQIQYWRQQHDQLLEQADIRKPQSRICELIVPRD
ncbi:hypothetical protein O6H91_12G086900 [Diphasiastrum complanatum]|uniref:Uncharacterized protein n=2 Tax=Diphasiastrum complanatum TaxID=34168 RepID=A0ACC2C4T5_DIPCM|nr:hypothetical protein O6H91_12G086900 [Diphasiastrum complanatum]KAJ7536889.1 hypothetical protein O6H91_12G086900 [Diphasiastrum complanatum]